ncbi:MAG: GNAT family N-acetyltransferase [Candidatus Thermoplasmatota archaeon]|nr:GNAT family N-acetyltransferase [Candidatus Thermoplasmatota archaeon]
MTDDTVEVADAPDVPGLTFHRYRGDKDLPLLVEVLEAVSVADDLEWVVTAERLKNEYDNLPRFDPREDVVLAQVNGRTVGYSQVHWFEEPDGTFAAGHRERVHPDWREKGISEALLAVNTTRAKELAATLARGPSRMGTVVAETETHRISVLERAGYRTERFYLEMLRDLSEPIDDNPLPEGIVVRPAGVEDQRRVFDTTWEAFRGSYGFREMTEKDWTGFLASPEFQPELWFVGWDGDVVAGAVFCWIDEEENTRYDRRWGYNDDIAVAEGYRRRGLAKALISRSLLALRDLGMAHAYLSVDTQNPADALSLYEAVGYKLYKRQFDMIRPLDPL